MSARTKDERINEKADELYSLLKDQIKFDLKQGGSCGQGGPDTRCGQLDCWLCTAIKLIEWIDKKPLTL